MAEIISFKTKEKTVTNPEDGFLTCDEVLDGAKGVLTKVILIGVHTDGSYYFGSNLDSKPYINMMIDEFKADLVAGRWDDNGQEE